MRIRRRQAPLLLPSLQLAPPSDLPPKPSPPVQHRDHHMVSHPHENLSPQQPQTVHFRPPQPDQANQRVSPMGAGAESADGWDWPETEKKERLEMGGDEEVEDERLRAGEKSTDTRKGSTSGAETGSCAMPFSSSSGEVGRWGEGEKAFPLKKRRGSLERRGGGGGLPMNQETIMEKEKKMKTKMNNKCVRESDDDEHGPERERETKQGFDSTAAAAAAAASAKKRSRGGTLMEGSRCSRVNGRGWRCCQQTLVGYSLCEHHLGKGRLRSMSSVRSRAVGKNQTQELFNPFSQLPQKNQEEKEKENPVQEDKGEAANDEKPLTGSGGGGAKRRVKIGMVKARSLSSLLGQPSSAVVVAVAADDDNK